MNVGSTFFGATGTLTTGRVSCWSLTVLGALSVAMPPKMGLFKRYDAGDRLFAGTNMPLTTRSKMARNELLGLQ